MLTSKELREKRAKLADEIKRLAKKSDDETEEFTSEDKERWGNVNAEYDDLTRQIRSLELQEEDSQISNPLGIGREDLNVDRLSASDTEIWRTDTGEEVRVFGRTGSLEDFLRQRSGDEREDLSLGGFLRAMVLGARNEAEKRALAEGTDSAGGYATPQVLIGRIIDSLRADAVCFRAGARVVPLTTDVTRIARLASDPVATWRAENAAVAESDPTFEGVTFEPETLAVVVRASRELIEDAPNLERALERAFRGAMSLKVDQAGLVGSGTSNEPSGIKNFSNINSVSMGTNGAAISNYDEFIDVMEDIAEDNGMDPTAAVMAPRGSNSRAVMVLPSVSVIETISMPPL